MEDRDLIESAQAIARAILEDEATPAHTARLAAGIDRLLALAVKSETPATEEGQWGM